MEIEAYLKNFSINQIDPNKSIFDLLSVLVNVITNLEARVIELEKLTNPSSFKWE